MGLRLRRERRRGRGRRARRSGSGARGAGEALRLVARAVLPARRHPRAAPRARPPPAGGRRGARQGARAGRAAAGDPGRHRGAPDRDVRGLRRRPGGAVGCVRRAGGPPRRAARAPAQRLRRVDRERCPRRLSGDARRTAGGDRHGPAVRPRRLPDRRLDGALGPRATASTARSSARAGTTRSSAARRPSSRRRFPTRRTRS